MEPLGGSGNRTNFKSNAPLSWNANICKFHCFNQISLPLLKSRNNIMFHIISQMEHLGGSGDWTFFKSKIPLPWSAKTYKVNIFYGIDTFHEVDIFAKFTASLKEYPSAKVENTIKLITIIRMEHRRGSGDWTIFESKAPLHWSEHIYRFSISSKNNHFHEVRNFVKFIASIKAYSSAKVEKQYHAPPHKSNWNPSMEVETK
jgi:hypothetical protein